MNEMNEERLALVLTDLAGYTRTTQSLDALAAAEFLERYYAICSEEISARGGRVVKWLGDACLAVFPVDRTTDAVSSVEAIEARCGGDLDTRLGASVHVATVAAGRIGPEGARGYDVIGSGVNHLFLMRRGRVELRISEPVYRQLDNERRGVWHKDKPPASYVRQSGGAAAERSKR